MAPLPAPQNGPLLTVPGTRVHRLKPSDACELVAFLEQRPADNAYLLGHIARGGLEDGPAAGVMIGWWSEGRLTGAALIGSNLVLSHGAGPEALAAFAAYTRASPWVVRVIVGPDDVVRDFVEALRLPPEQVLLTRAGQVLLQVDKHTLRRDARSLELRPAQANELDAMMAIDLEMVREELGIDPFSTDMPGYQRGWQRRLLEWRAWVAGPLGGPIRCKVDQAAVSDQIVQLAGVYTAPAFRRQGLARGVIGEMCHLLLREAPRVALYVHAHNLAAIRLYRGLGFYEVGRVRSLWLRGRERHPGLGSLQKPNVMPAAK